MFYIYAKRYYAKGVVSNLSSEWAFEKKKALLHTSALEKLNSYIFKIPYFRLLSTYW